MTIFDMSRGLGNHAGDSIPRLDGAGPDLLTADEQRFVDMAQSSGTRQARALAALGLAVRPTLERRQGAPTAIVGRQTVRRALPCNCPGTKPWDAERGGLAEVEDAATGKRLPFRVDHAQDMAGFRLVVSRDAAPDVVYLVEAGRTS